MDAAIKKPVVNYSTSEPTSTNIAQEPKASLSALLPNISTEAKPSKPTLRRSSKLSLSNSISINPASKKQEAATDEKIDIRIRPKKEFSKEKYTETIKNYRAILKEKGKDSLASIFEVIPEIKEHLIHLLIENKALDEEFNSQRSDFLDYIRKELANYDVEVKTTVNKDVKLKKAYTPQEKFTKMSERNPHLKDLVKKLNMDVGYA